VDECKPLHMGTLGGRTVAVSGNFISAKRRGVVNGVDFLYTGDVVAVDANAVRVRLQQGDVVLLSSLGFNAAGQVLNCQCYDVAVSVAIDLRADKLISYVAPDAMPRNEDGSHMKYMPLSLAEEYIVRLAREGASGSEVGAWSEAAMAAVGAASSSSPAAAAAEAAPAAGGQSDWMLDSWRWLNQDSRDPEWSETGISSPWQRLTERGLQWRVAGCPQEVCAAVFSCKAGVRRAHLIDYTLSGALLLELYTFDGRGLHSSTSQLNFSRVGHTNTPYTPHTPPNTPLTRATQTLRAAPIPYKALKLS